MITFEQFQGSREACRDIGNAISADMGREQPITGNLYLGALYIETVDSHWPEEIRARGAWYLLIGRDEYFSNDLEPLERKLFEFASSEGYDKSTLNDLIREYADWNARQGLSLGSADEHWHDETLTDEQRAWVRNFSARWDIAAESECKQHRDDGRSRCIDCGGFI